MRILVLATDYPNNDGGVSLMYIHARNRVYVSASIEVEVINFSTQKGYEYDGIKVMSLAEYEEGDTVYDVLILHAANVRNHYKFLKEYGDRFERFVFFFHGHEVLKIRDTYPIPYFYLKNRGISNSFIQDIYDSIKLNVWKKYLPTVYEKSQFIFVSEWMRIRFEKYVKITPPSDKTYIIPNMVGNVFEKEKYNTRAQKQYDFVTIRSNLDGSKYCIDVVNRIASENPSYSFLIIGKGKFFDYNNKPTNITWISENLKHEDIPRVLDSAKCALMPTRLDAQGVMMCEMATYGIPVITSKIDICYELSNILENMILIDNDSKVDLSKYDSSINELALTAKNSSFYEKNTVGKEVEILQGKL